MASILVAILGQAGTTVRGAYDVLVSMAVISYFIPYLLLFASMIKLQDEPAGPNVRRVPGKKPVAIALALVGFIATATTIVLSLFPGADQPNKVLAIVKVAGATLVQLGLGHSDLYCGTAKSPPRGPHRLDNLDLDDMDLVTTSDLRFLSASLLPAANEDTGPQGCGDEVGKLAVIRKLVNQQVSLFARFKRADLIAEAEAVRRIDRRGRERLRRRQPHLHASQRHHERHRGHRRRSRVEVRRNHDRESSINHLPRWRILRPAQREYRPRQQDRLHPCGSKMLQGLLRRSLQMIGRCRAKFRG